MREERSFIYGFRTGHCVRGIIMFACMVAFDAFWVVTSNLIVIRAVNGVIGAFFVLMTFQMVRHLRMRQTGARKIVVGARALTAPESISNTRPVEIAYGDMRDVVATGGEKGKLVIQHKGGTLDIDRMMLASDGEFDELIGAVRKHVGR